MDANSVVRPPAVPTEVRAVGGEASATVSWRAPDDNGGSPITGYELTSAPGGFTAQTEGATSAVVTGLSNGARYTFTVSATNMAGTGGPSDPSNGIRPGVDVFPRWLFQLEAVYLVGLWVLALIYAEGFFGVRIWIPSTIAGSVPIGVLWWGAVGAVLVGFYGIFFHNKDWNQSYNPWHIARPITGMTLGSVSYLILKSAGAGLQFEVYYLLAFLVGFSERTFRDLLERTTKHLLGSSGGG